MPVYVPPVRVTVQLLSVVKPLTPVETPVVEFPSMVQPVADSVPLFWIPVLEFPLTVELRQGEPTWIEVDEACAAVSTDGAVCH